MDMAKIGQMLLNRGAYGSMRFFSEETFQKMLPRGSRRGIGTVGGKNRIYHPAASMAVFSVDLDNELIIVMCRNRPGKVWHDYSSRFIETVNEGMIK